MSEKDKLRREEYRRRRKRWLVTLTALLLLSVIAAAYFFGVYYQLNKTTYIPYTESGEADYTVHLLPNDFYEEESLPAGQSYVASLIDQITAEFGYAMQMESSADFVYSYEIVTQLLVKNASGEILYDPTETVMESDKHHTSSGNALSISEKVPIDYIHYNDLAKTFISTYQINGATGTLRVSMNIHVLGSSSSFAQNAENSYTVALNIPLNAQTVRITSDTSVPTENGRVLAHNPAKNQALYLQLAIGPAALALLLLIVLLLFIRLTRNTDIHYAIKVKRLVRAYKSYIQQIINAFDTSHYQVLAVKTFNEMLDIRDTIQSPILMHENEDKTRTQFIIPTNNGILYCFEIKVDNYDELYAPLSPVQDEYLLDPVQEGSAAETPVAEEVIEEIAVEEVVEEVAAEAALPEELAAEEAEESNENAFDFGPRFDYSFEAKLALADEEVRGFYRSVVSFARSYGVKVSRSWSKERIYLGRKLFALLLFKGKKLSIALALDPATHGDPKYHAFDMSGSRKYEKTPMLMRITSPRKVKYAIELLTELFMTAELENKNLGIEEPLIPAKSKRTLVLEGLIKTDVHADFVSDEVRRDGVAELDEVPVEDFLTEDTVTEITEDLSENADAKGSGFDLGGPKLDYSFEAKLALSTKEVRDFYTEVSDFARAWGVKVSRSWPRERIYLGHNLFALLLFKGKKLSIALALDPATHGDPKYHAFDMSGSRKYEKTPMLMRITSPRKVKYAIELLSELFTAAGLPDKKLAIPPTKTPAKTKKALLEAGLIRVEGAQSNK